MKFTNVYPAIPRWNGFTDLAAFGLIGIVKLAPMAAGVAPNNKAPAKLCLKNFLRVKFILSEFRFNDGNKSTLFFGNNRTKHKDLLIKKLIIQYFAEFSSEHEKLSLELSKLVRCRIKKQNQVLLFT